MSAGGWKTCCNIRVENKMGEVENKCREVENKIGKVENKCIKVENKSTVNGHVQE
jgi:hypothetical protein